MSKDWLEPELRAAVNALNEWQRAAVVAYGEARSEPIQGIVAVCRTFVNRVDAKSWFGKDISEVVLKSWQYSCLHPKGGEKNYQRVLALAEKLAKRESVTDPKWLQCAWAARGVVGGLLLDNIKRATHYHTSTMTPRPAWAQNQIPVVQIGGHVFYSGIK